MSNETLLTKAVEELAIAILDKEYGKDARNEKLIRMLAEGAWINFALATKDADQSGESQS